MGLLDCVASPEERDKFEEDQKPYSRPRELSRSDHDISRRRTLPLFASHANLKNIRDIDFWRTRVLRFLFSPEGREDIRILKVPFKQLGYLSVTDFIGEIPTELFSEFLNQTPPDEGIFKDDKVFWVRDGIAEPGVFKWQGVIENLPIIGVQLDRKKAVPFGIHDGKGLFYCKPGHRGLLPEHEVTPYKKFLRSFLGLTPRKDSLIGMRDSVRYSAKALAAKNSKPGDRVYLPKEKKWAIVQWIGKIEGETVVDLVYEPLKPEAGKPVSPDEPCISRSMSLADFIGELASEPNTPVTVQPKEVIQQTPQISAGTGFPSPKPEQPPPPTSPLPESSNESLHSEHPMSSTEEDSNSEDDSDSDSDHSMLSGTEEESDNEDDGNIQVPSIGSVQVETNNEEKTAEAQQIEDEMSMKIPSPKRKGFFGLSQNKRQKRPKSPTVLTAEQKAEFVSLPELKHPPASPPASAGLRNSKFFASLKFKKGNKQKKQPSINDESPIKTKAKKSPAPSSKKKSALSSSWGAFFKSKSKTQLQKLVLDETTSLAECTTPIDDMTPPDKIPTPPPFQQQHPLPASFNERRVDRPEHLSIMPDTYEKSSKGENDPDISENGKVWTRGEISLCPDDDEASSESETSGTDEEEEQSETQNITVQMHTPPSPKTPEIVAEARKDSIKITTLEKEVVQEFSIKEKNEEFDSEPGQTETSSPENDGVNETQYMPNSLERYKETRVRNRPSSFGSFLARIKNIKSNSDDVPPAPSTPVPPTPISQEGVLSGIEPDKGSASPEENDDRKNSIRSDSSSDTHQIDGKESNDESAGEVFGINRSLVKPQVGVKSAVELEGNQEGIVLDFLDVKEPTLLVNSPPPVPTVDPPKLKPSRNRSFTFSFSGKRKNSHPQTPSTPTPKEEQDKHISDEEIHNVENRENIEPHMESSPKKGEGEEIGRKQSKPNSFRSSFKRTFSLTRSKKRASIDTDPGTPTSPTTPTNRISKPRPVTMYIDNNEAVQTRDSFRNKRPTSLVVDIKPWNTRHRSNDADILSSPSSDEAPTSPSSKSPNPALLPKQSEINIPKHRMFTTPSIFYKKPTKKSDNEPLIPKTSKDTFYKNWNAKETKSHSPSPPSSAKTSPLHEQSPAVPEAPSPPHPAPPPPLEESVPLQGSGSKLKLALKQRKEIDSIPKGLKVNDRVLWYSGKGPIPGTVLRLFKDGTDKYTAMVKFDREVQEEPLCLTREGDAYIITVEELITPNMFEPTTYVTQSEVNEEKEIVLEPVTPITPSVRFNGLVEDSSPEVLVTPDTPEVEEHDLPPPFQEEEVTMACGFRRGIQCRDKSCCLETILFSMFYTTNAFDITMLYANTSNEDTLTGKVRRILRKEIVDPLRREGFCPWFAIKKLRDAVKPLSDEWQTLSTDAEVMMFILFDRALKLQKFISYSNDMSDFLHQLVVDTKDLSKSTTVQHLFETSLRMMDRVKLTTVPTPALILEMPRSNDKLMQYKAVIPNMSLSVSHILDGGPRLCICGAVAKYDCKTCTENVGAMSIVYCDNCKSTADVIHYQLPHDAQLTPLNQPVVILDLSAIVCVKGGHYFSFVKCGQELLSPWVFFDGAELENPKVCIEQNLSMWLDRLEKYPGRYQDALQYPLLTHILQDSHICIYQPREKSSSV